MGGSGTNSVFNDPNNANYRQPSSYSAQVEPYFNRLHPEVGQAQQDRQNLQPIQPGTQYYSQQGQPYAVQQALGSTGGNWQSGGSIFGSNSSGALGNAWDPVNNRPVGAGWDNMFRQPSIGHGWGPQNPYQNPYQNPFQNPYGYNPYGQNPFMFNPYAGSLTANTPYAQNQLFGSAGNYGVGALFNDYLLGPGGNGTPGSLFGFPGPLPTLPKTGALPTGYSLVPDRDFTATLKQRTIQGPDGQRYIQNTDTGALTRDQPMGIGLPGQPNPFQNVLFGSMFPGYGYGGGYGYGSPWGGGYYRQPYQNPFMGNPYQQPIYWGGNMPVGGQTGFGGLTEQQRRTLLAGPVGTAPVLP